MIDYGASLQNVYTPVGAFRGLTEISLGDILQNPQQALPQVQSNLMNNWQGILVGSFMTAFAFKTVKKVLRGPIGKVNRGLFGKRGLIGNVGFKI